MARSRLELFKDRGGNGGNGGGHSQGFCCPGRLLAGDIITRMAESLLEQQTPPDLLYFYGQIRKIGFY